MVDLSGLIRGSRGKEDVPFLALAPLAGYTDLPFRLLCAEHGAGLVYTEMVSSHGLVQGQNKTWEMLATCAQERPVEVQLFGAMHIHG